MNQVRPVTEPLVEDAGRVILVEAKLEIDMRIERTPRLAQQPAFPVRILFPQFRWLVHPFLPLHIHVPQPLARDARIRRSEPPPLLIDVPFLLDVDDVADAARADDVPYRERIG